MRERLRKLRSRLAIPGYVLVAWGAIGNVSRMEYVVRKMDQVAQLPYARLALIALGFAWLAWLVSRKPPGTDASAERLTKMKSLVGQAQADFAARKVERAATFKEAAERSMHLLSIQAFLKQAFRHHVLMDYQKFLDHERALWEAADAAWDYNQATAEWLGALGRRITADDLDPGFLLPHDYHQHMKADSWTPNRRPL